eukprot:CAMPEP_0182439516 /NCGR_PEP_ID=MMETSP1167-20130531/86489_1 /TAXON_ID=2988 /ORGANISM="Mallomonas Sp, Strain CCMP3275" /LENGTH=107 /DNA_ID=CAMNT_0024633241 /DNA_START=801 /DNA_END=1124 /DNA_ORIENTATION=+
MAEMCGRAEHEVAGASAGLMDQLAVGREASVCPVSQAQELIGINCRYPLVPPVTETISLPEGMSVVAVDSGVTRSISGEKYTTARVASQIGAHIISNMMHSTSSREP